ncbi:MAG: hypothetical protein IKA95_06995 [Clostridia bacterium]|nr:hypothetical protein [Clostridia bacterium]
MKLKTVVELLDAKILGNSYNDNKEVFAACGSDLMSDVLAFVKDQALLLTGLVNSQVVRTAEMMDMNAIVFVRGKVPGDDILSLADEAGIAILSTELPLYISCGKLYSEGLYK